MRSSRKNSMVWIALLVILALVPGMAGWPAILAEGDLEITVVGDDPAASDLDVPEGQGPLPIDGATGEPGLDAGLLTEFGLSTLDAVTEEPAYAAPVNPVDTSDLNGTN